jgi:hypothetical protein
MHNDATGKEERGESPRDGVTLDHAYTMREFVETLWEELSAVTANGWWDEEDERQFGVPGDVGWNSQPLWFER